MLNADETINDSDKTIAVPTNSRVRPISLWIEYTASTNTGSRVIVRQIRDSAADQIGGARSAALTGTQTGVVLDNFLSVCRRSTQATGAATTLLDLNGAAPTISETWSWPFDRLPQAFDVRVFDSAVIAVAADDMIIQFLWEEWIED